MNEGIAFCFGAILMAAFTLISLNEHIEVGEEARVMIKECQKDLRRDEYCTIIAVPTDEVEGE